VVSDFASSIASLEFVAAVDILIDTKASASIVEPYSISLQRPINPILLHPVNARTFSHARLSTRVTMVVRLKIYDDNGVPIGDLSTRGGEEAANEEEAVLSGLFDVSLAAGEGILGTVYIRSNAPAEIGHERFGEPWARTIYGSELEGHIVFHPFQARPSLRPSIM
jgi:hypothetical protein